MSLSLERASWPVTKCRPAFEWSVALQVKQTFFDSVADDLHSNFITGYYDEGQKGQGNHR
jgi:hypothetical protein